MEYATTHYAAIPYATRISPYIHYDHQTTPHERGALCRCERNSDSGFTGRNVPTLEPRNRNRTEGISGNPRSAWLRIPAKAGCGSGSPLGSDTPGEASLLRLWGDVLRPQDPSNSRNAAVFSSAITTNRLPSPRWACATNIVLPPRLLWRRPQDHPTRLRLPPRARKPRTVP